MTALASDPAAEELRGALDAAGVDIVDLALDGTTPEKIRITTGGRSLLRLDRGGADVVVGPMSATAREAIGWAAGVLVADYGARRRRASVRPGGARPRRAGRSPSCGIRTPNGPPPVPGARW